MTISPTQRVLILFSLSGALIAGCALVIFSYLLPHMHMTRAQIDSRRATLTALQQRRSNLQALKQETDSVAAAATTINGEIWSFTTEDSFYTTVASLEKAAGVHGDDPKVTDAIPGPQAIVRTVTMNVTGRAANLNQFLDALQAAKPLIAIQDVVITGAPTTEQTMQITATTIWQ